jgi:hypothetical protein
VHEIAETPPPNAGMTYEQMTGACGFGLQPALSLRLT